MLRTLRELGELKRVRSAGRAGSIAERRFLLDWSALCGGADPHAVMLGSVSALLAAARLGDLDRPVLLELGVPRADADAIHRAAVAELRPDLLPGTAPLLDAATAAAVELPAGPVPNFATLLAAQPRAGVTCPGLPRLLFEPPENHAEHCGIVALYAVLLAPAFGADPTIAWLASLAHHLHNALLPDSGFSGEMLLGAHLEPVMARATEHSLAQLPPVLAERVRDARRILPDADTAEGRAFHAADTLDRVWQIDQHLRAGRTSLDFVLNDMALVHAGPVKEFQDRLLRGAGLLR
ncbi:MAG: hypothetical protein INR65_15360 [Gluconacetobacter diazotrophicus]|nr:hypothetical protein [Gluconacetobacter diazotrophicus]